MATFFSGSNQYLRVASAPAQGVPMTIAAHARSTSIPHSTSQTIGAVGQAPQPGRNRNQLIVTAAGGVRAVAVGSAVAGIEAPGIVAANVWFHAAGVFTSLSSRSVYLNGTSASTAGTITQASLTELAIGAQQGPSTGTYENPWFGNIAEFGIWNVALTAAEISSLSKGMACNLIRPQSLVFYAPLVRDLIDERSGLTITNVNSATVANHPRIYY